jgi:O-succinylbenzoate synthase
MANLDTGAITFGEIAPLPAFGSESLETALAFMESLGTELSGSKLSEATKCAPPATGFGLWSASQCPPDPEQPTAASSAALLTLDEATAASISALRKKGYRTFKIKTGIAENSLEWSLIQDVIGALQPGDQVRLDPNQSWDSAVGSFWLPRLEEFAGWIQYIEDPFLPGLLSVQQLMTIAEDSHIPMALDESISRGGMATWIEAAWSGFWIIKPSLLGHADNWMTQLSFARDKTILSSAFETGIGLSALVSLANLFPGADHGLGTADYFEDEFGPAFSGAGVTGLDLQQQETIWNRLPNG